MAILIWQSHPLVAANQIRIWATDISWRALEAAQEGVYDPHSLRHTEPGWLSKHFQPDQNGRMLINGRARQMVHIEFQNLIKPLLAKQANSMDMVLCRNVIIYFDQESRKKVLDNFYTVLKPGGYLLLGHSESLAYISTPFEMSRIGEAIVYRKPV